MDALNFGEHKSDPGVRDQRAAKGLVFTDP
jgi:hypothetical protein